MTHKKLGLVLLLAACGGTNGSGGGGATQNGLACPPSPAPAIFTNALCLCGDFVDVGALRVGASPVAGNPSVGVNGTTHFVNHVDVDGGWVAWAGAQDVGDTHVAGNVVTPADFDVIGNFEVKKDFSVGGVLRGAGRLKIDGALRVGGNNAMIGFAQVASTGAYTAPAGPPCPCAPSQLLDVAGKVAAAKTNNNNGALASIGVTELALPTGSYYFTDVETIGLTRFRIDGAVALYIDGDLDSIGAERIKLSPGATLDLYVSGTVRTIGYFNAGDAANPSAFRLYVGSGDRLTLSVGYQKFAGSIYAPKATIAYVGDTIVEGGLFANNLVGVGLLTIGASAPAAPSPSTCTPPTTGSGNTGGAGTGGVTATPPIM